MITKVYLIKTVSYRSMIKMKIMVFTFVKSCTQVRLCRLALRCTTSIKLNIAILTNDRTIIIVFPEHHKLS